MTSVPSETATLAYLDGTGQRSSSDLAGAVASVIAGDLHGRRERSAVRSVEGTPLPYKVQIVSVAFPQFSRFHAGNGSAVPRF